MKTLSSVLLAAAFAILTSVASASDKVDVIVVTAKQPAATMLSDMTDEIVTATGDAIRSQQPGLQQPAIAAPQVQIKMPALTPARG